MKTQKLHPDLFYVITSKGNQNSLFYYITISKFELKYHYMKYHYISYSITDVVNSVFYFKSSLKGSWDATYYSFSFGLTTENVCNVELLEKKHLNLSCVQSHPQFILKLSLCTLQNNFIHIFMT